MLVKQIYLYKNGMVANGYIMGFFLMWSPNVKDMDAPLIEW